MAGPAAVAARPASLVGVLTLLVTEVFPGRVELSPQAGGTSEVGDPPGLPERVAARERDLMKEGRKELRGEVGDAGVCEGEPFVATKGVVGSGMWVGRLDVGVARDMLESRG